MENDDMKNITVEIRMLADAPPNKKFISKYQQALEHLGDIPDIPESTGLLSEAAMKAIIEERNRDKARSYEEKIEFRRKRELKKKISENLKVAMESNQVDETVEK